MTRKRPLVSTIEVRRARGLVQNEEMSLLAQSKRAGKYNARGCHLNKHTLEPTHKKDPERVWFASEAEAERYKQLRVLASLGQIRKLRVQPTFVCTWAGVHICTYRADFAYLVDAERGSYEVVEDVKGMLLDTYEMKKRCVLAAHKVAITEIPSKKVRQWAMKIPPPSG
jgi:Protein of unknown function (DUF1064)